MRTATETLEAARDARSAGEVDRCLLLSAAAQSLARDEHDAESAFLAARMPGRMFYIRGESDTASGFFREALHIALESGLTLKLPIIYHDLYVAHRDVGSEAAKRYCATATELYLDLNHRNPRLTALMADAAEGRFMMNPCTDTAADALQAWRSVPASLSDHSERFLAGCCMMVSAAWLSIRCRYADGVRLMEGAFPNLPDHEGASLALSYGATGAMKARDYLRASHMAAEAVRIAVARGEAIAEARAREVLAAALAERREVRHI